MNIEFHQPAGTYLIRWTDNIPNGYCLSVKTYSEESIYEAYEVLHFKIQELSSQKYRFANEVNTFSSLDELIKHKGKFIIDPYSVCSVFGLIKLTLNGKHLTGWLLIVRRRLVNCALHKTQASAVLTQFAITRRMGNCPRQN